MLACWVHFFPSVHSQKPLFKMHLTHHTSNQSLRLSSLLSTGYCGEFIFVFTDRCRVYFSTCLIFVELLQMSLQTISMFEQELQICGEFSESHLIDKTYCPGSRVSGTATRSLNTQSASSMPPMSRSITVHCDPVGVVYLCAFLSVHIASSNSESSL